SEERDAPDLKLARGQILDYELSPRVDLRLRLILRRLIHSARRGEKSVPGRQRPANDPKFASNRERAVNQDDANASHLLSRVSLDPLARRRAATLDSRKPKAARV